MGRTGKPALTESFNLGEVPLKRARDFSGSGVEKAPLAKNEGPLSDYTFEH